jgi:hypothetical protein
MAILYYPAGNFLGARNTANPGFEQIILNNNPSTVFYFGTGSGINAVTASMMLITSSYSTTSSWTFASISSSYANSASFANQSISSSYARSASWAPGTTSSSYNYQTGSYTLQNGDLGTNVVVNSSSFSIITIPSGLSSSFNCKFYQSGSGRIVFTGSLGVNIRSVNNVFSSAGQHSTVNLYIGKSGEYILEGDLGDFNAQLVGWEDFSSLTPGNYTNTGSGLIFTTASLWQSSCITGSFFVGSGSGFHLSSNKLATSQSINYVQFTSSNVYFGKMLNGNNYNVVRIGALGAMPGGTTTGGVNSSMFLGLQPWTSSTNQYIIYIQNFTFYNAPAPDACYVPNTSTGYNGGRNVNGSFSDSTPKTLGGVVTPSYMGMPIFVSPRAGFIGMQFNKTTGSLWSIIAYQGYTDFDYTYEDLRIWLETGRMNKPFSRAVQPGVYTTTISESFGLLDTATFNWATNPGGTDANTKPMTFYAFGASNCIY